MTIDESASAQSPCRSKLIGSSLCFGNDCFSGEAIQSLKFDERLEGNHIVKSSSATVVLPEEVRWNYHAETDLKGPQDLNHRGICVRAEWQKDGSMSFSFEGALWEFERSSVKNIEIFGMSNLEVAYWFPQLTGLVRGVEVPGLSLDEEFRPFLYAVPLQGLSAAGTKKFFFFRDFGVTSGDKDDVFQPLLNDSNIGKTESVWGSDVPKAWGVVFARDLIEAEALALNRARFTADLISFGLGSGISHFETRYESEPLEWDVDIGRSRIGLEPWVMLLDQKNTKGWIRTIPLVEVDSTIDLEDGYERIAFFAERFLEASEAGDFIDQTDKRILSDRERRLSAGIQRSLRWLSIASNEESVGDQFIAVWISLESILNALEYPEVFGGDREPVGDALKGAISALNLPRQASHSLSISKEMVEGRTLQNQWPLRTKLALFAKACGVKLKSDDSTLVRDLSRIRNEIFHAGRSDAPVSKEQLKRLQYLVERLVVATSVYGYEDIEEQSPHELQFGEIGPEGGGAPLTLNGRDVPYTFRIMQDKAGIHTEEFVIEGKIYSRQNSKISFAKKE